MIRFILVQVRPRPSLSPFLLPHLGPPLSHLADPCTSTRPQNRQGKTRLSKFYVPYEEDEKARIRGEVHRSIAPRDQKYQSNFVEVRPLSKSPGS